MGKLTDEKKAEVKALVAEITEVEDEQLTPEAQFVDDLGVDSMMALEVVAAIEKKYGVTIPEEEIPNISSLQKVYDLLEANLAE